MFSPWDFPCVFLSFSTSSSSCLQLLSLCLPLSFSLLSLSLLPILLSFLTNGGPYKLNDLPNWKLVLLQQVWSLLSYFVGLQFEEH